MEILPGLPEEGIRKVNCANALAVYGHSGQMREEGWLNPPRSIGAHFIRTTQSCGTASLWAFIRA